MQYSTQLLECFDRTSHAGALNISSDHVRHTRVGCMHNGEVLDLYLLILENRIQNASFLAHGSPALIACAEFLCEWLLQKTMAEVSNLTPALLLAALELPKTRIHVASLCLSAVEKLIKDHHEQANPQSCIETSMA